MTVRGCAFDAPLPFEQRGEAFFAYGSSADTGHKRTLLFQLMVFFFLEYAAPSGVSPGRTSHGTPETKLQVCQSSQALAKAQTKHSLDGCQQKSTGGERSISSSGEARHQSVTNR